LEVAVVGVPHEKWGESPKAFVVVRAGASVTESDLREFARHVLAHFKVPSSFEFLSSLPKTATGKVQKYILRKGESSISRQ
jgi:fatty-acyl-CoA synthase